jgi:hypothetical protein
MVGEIYDACPHGCQPGGLHRAFAEALERDCG